MYLEEFNASVRRLLREKAKMQGAMLMKGNSRLNTPKLETHESNLKLEDLFDHIYEIDNEAAWKAFFEWSQAEVFAIARRKGLSATEADDLFQNVMVVLVGEITTAEGGNEHSNIRAWIRSIASHKASDVLRRCRVSERLDTLSVEWTSQNAEISEETAWKAEVLRVALNNVRDRTNEEDFNVFDLVMIQGRKALEIARFLNKSIDSVYRAKKRVLMVLLVEFQHLAESLF